MPTPACEDVIDEVVDAIDDGNPSWGTILGEDLRYESELEAIEDYQESDNSNGAEWGIDLWVVTCEKIDEVAGEAVGENYSIYRIVCKYWNVRSGDANWESGARAQVEAARAALNQNTDVFRIAGQVQLRTPETASVESQGFQLVEGMKVFKARIVLDVEGRNWAA